MKLPKRSFALRGAITGSLSLDQPRQALIVATVGSAILFLLVGLLPGLFYHVFKAPVYLPLHNLAELASIFVSFGIFLVNWHSFPLRRNARNLLLGVAFLGVAALDTLHMLSFPGMPDLVSASSTNKGILYWLSARLTEAMALLLAAFIANESGNRLLRRRPLMMIVVGLVAAVFVGASFFERELPAMYVDGSGLTPLKVALEYTVIGLNVAAAVVYVRTASARQRRETSLLLAALSVIIFAELAFTLYRSAYDSYNLLGHIYKVVAYYLLFRALFVSSIVEPHRALARSEAEQSRLYRTERRKSRELLAAGRLLQSPLGLQQRLEAVARAARDLLEVEASAILLLDETKSTFSLVAASGVLDKAQQQQWPASGTLAAEVLARGKARWLNDASTASSATEAPAKSDEFRSRLCAPLRVAGNVMGVLEAYSSRPGMFGARQAILLSGFADASAIAMTQAKAHDEIQKLLEQMRRSEQRLAEQNEELQAQAVEIQAQNEELARSQQELEHKNVAVEQANRELIALYDVSRQQEARMRAIIDATGDGVMVVDGDHRIIAVNPALEQLTGCSGADLVGSRCQYLLHAHQSDGTSVCDSTCPFLHHAGQGPNNVDAILPGRDGTDLWVNIVYGPIYDRDGKITAVVHAIRDISSRKELERQKDEFLSIAAHDLRSPLTAIRGYAQLLIRRALKERRGEDEYKGLEVIEAQVEKMVSMINRLFDLTRIQMGRLELQQEPTDLRQIAERVVCQLSVASDAHKVELEAASDVAFTANVDRNAIERVLGNLIENAVKYSPRGGVVRVRLEQGAGEVRVSVTDQGIGIAEADLERVFDRYFRASGARETAKGLGLGLYIAKSIVEAHGGRMWAASTHGAGSTFWFTLPTLATLLDP